MYAAHFGLREPPFNNTPDPRFFRATPDHEEALACLIYGVQERKGFSLLTGEVGAGKTLVARMMLRHFGDSIASAVITNTALNADDLLAAICSEFGVEPARPATRFDFITALQDYLLGEFAADRLAVLVLDEAQNLSDECFEQIRMIGNLEADNAKLVQIVIVGQPELRERLAADHMCQLSQRIFRSYHLPALSREATDDYVQHRLEVARGTPTAGDGPVNAVFDDQALAAIFAQSRGLPRMINTVCDNAMLGAFAAERQAIDGPFMTEVIEQLATGTPLESKGRLSSTDDQPRPARVDAGSLTTALSTTQDDQGCPTEENEQRVPAATVPPERIKRIESAPAASATPEPDEDDEEYNLGEISARAWQNVRRVGKIYAAADQTYRHLIHHLSEIQRPTTRLSQPPTTDGELTTYAELTVARGAESAEATRQLHDLLDSSRSSLDTLRNLVGRTNR